MGWRGGPGSRWSAPAPGLEPEAGGGFDQWMGGQSTGAGVEIGAFLEDLDGQDQRAVARAGLEEGRRMVDGPERRGRTAEEDGVGAAHAERDGHLGGNDGRSRLREADAHPGPR